MQSANGNLIQIVGFKMYERFLNVEIFPDISKADADGLLAVGGNLSVEMLLNAYAHGIFPWFMAGEPVLWWSPDPRMVLFPDAVNVSKNLGRQIRKFDYEIRIDTRFDSVIRHCASANGRTAANTWITNDMILAYNNMHNEGFAHSFETYLDGRLVGGLYGVSLGRAFFGESMFYLEPEASKIALVYLSRLMKPLNFSLIDVQQETGHLRMMGAVTIPRAEFRTLLKKSLEFETLRGKWTKFGNQFNLLKSIP